MSDTTAVTLNETDQIMLGRLLLTIPELSKYGSDAAFTEVRLLASIMRERLSIAVPVVQIAEAA